METPNQSGNAILNQDNYSYYGEKWKTTRYKVRVIDALFWIFCHRKHSEQHVYLKAKDAHI